MTIPGIFVGVGQAVAVVDSLRHIHQHAFVGYISGHVIDPYLHAVSYPHLDMKYGYCPAFGGVRVDIYFPKPKIGAGTGSGLRPERGA